MTKKYQTSRWMCTLEEYCERMGRLHWQYNLQGIEVESAFGVTSVETHIPKQLQYLKPYGNDNNRFAVYKRGVFIF